LYPPVPSSPLPSTPLERFAGIKGELGRLAGTRGFPDREEVPRFESWIAHSPESRISLHLRTYQVSSCVWIGTASGWSMGPPWGHQLLPAGGKALLVSRRRQVGAGPETAVRRVLRELAGERRSVRLGDWWPGGATSTYLAQARPRRLRDRVEMRRRDDRHPVRASNAACPSSGSSGAPGSSTSTDRRSSPCALP